MAVVAVEATLKSCHRSPPSTIVLPAPGPLPLPSIVIGPVIDSTEPGLMVPRPASKLTVSTSELSWFDSSIAARRVQSPARRGGLADGIGGIQVGESAVLLTVQSAAAAGAAQHEQNRECDGKG